MAAKSGIKSIKKDRHHQMKKTHEKYCLASPYCYEWPALEKGDNKSILDELRRVFPPLRVQKGSKSVPSSREDSSVESWRSAKNSLVVGVNEVTKSLEKDNLALVLVCNSTKPAILSNHLIFLCATRSTPACGLFGLSQVMAPLLGIKHVAACGFKKDTTVDFLENLVEYIVCKTPPLPSWTEIWSCGTEEHSVKSTADTTSTTTTHQTKTTTTIHQTTATAHQTTQKDKELTALSTNNNLKQSSVVSLRQDKLGYVKVNVKTLVPSGKTRVKRKKMKNINK